MSRARFEITTPTTVVLTTPEGESRVYQISHGAGHRYVRDEHGRQVCEGLERMGGTLTALDDGSGADLLATIRREWARARRWERAERGVF